MRYCPLAAYFSANKLIWNPKHVLDSNYLVKKATSPSTPLPAGEWFQVNEGEVTCGPDYSEKNH